MTWVFLFSFKCIDGLLSEKERRWEYIDGYSCMFKSPQQGWAVPCRWKWRRPLSSRFCSPHSEVINWQTQSYHKYQSVAALIRFKQDFATAGGQAWSQGASKTNRGRRTSPHSQVAWLWTPSKIVKSRNFISNLVLLRSISSLADLAPWFATLSCALTR